MRPALKVVLRLVVPDRLREWRADRWRARVERATAAVMARADGRVLAGPFAGMRYVSRSYSSQLGPKWLGSYELELGSILEEIKALEPETIVDVGAAEGYYAVGLLRQNPRAFAIAFESEADARRDLEHLAELNGMRPRLEIRERCDCAQLDTALTRPGRSVLVMDIDGGEEEMLDLSLVPRLRDTWILVEVHPHFLPNVRRNLEQRFGPTHRLRYIAAEDRRVRDLVPVAGIGGRDLVAAAWEARPDGQGWYWMEPNSAQSPR